MSWIDEQHQRSWEQRQELRRGEGRPSPELVATLLQQYAQLGIKPVEAVVEDDDEEEELCGSCSGSGEGQHDGTSCWSCGGKGILQPEKEEDDGSYEDYWEYQMDMHGEG